MALASGAASTATAQSAKTLRGECIKLYKSWQKREGYGAFAASESGGCGLSYNYGTIEEARARALSECRKRRRSKDCRIITESKIAASHRVPTLGAQSNNDAPTRIAKALDAWASKYKVVDASIVVVRNGKLVASHSIGSYEPGMLVPVASLSKAITGVCIAKLVQAGKIAFEDQLGSLLKEHFRIRPPYDPRASNITIGQLLTHKSGLSLDPTEGLGQFWPYTVSSMERQVDVALSFDLTPDAGKNFSYNNVNYSALGLVIETVTGESYEDYCFREVLAPVGVQNAKLNPDWMVMGAAGGWLISTTDYAKFLAYFDSRSSLLKLRPAKWPKADYRNGAQYGIGVLLRKAGKGYNFWHTGRWSIPKPFASFGACFASWHQEATVVVTFRPSVADEAIGELYRKLYAATSQ